MSPPAQLFCRNRSAQAVEDSNQGVAHDEASRARRLKFSPAVLTHVIFVGTKRKLSTIKMLPSAPWASQAYNLGPEIDERLLRHEMLY